MLGLSSPSSTEIDADADWKDVQPDKTLHQHKGHIPFDGEAPMNGGMALAYAIASPKGAAPSPDEISEAALALASLRSAGWDVMPGFAFQPASRAAPILCAALCCARKKTPTPKDHVDSENSITELRAMAFDLFRKTD